MAEIQRRLIDMESRGHQLTAIRSARLPGPIHKLLLRTIDDHIGVGHRWILTFKELAEEMCCSYATVRRAVDDLVEQQVIWCTRVSRHQNDGRREFGICWSNLKENPERGEEAVEETGRVPVCGSRNATVKSPRRRAPAGGGKGKPHDPPKPPATVSQKKTPFDAAAVDLPEELDTPEFRAAWRDWCEARKASRHAITQVACQRQLSQLQRVGVASAIEAIETSLRNDWRGLFPKDPCNLHTSGQRNQARIHTNTSYDITPIDL